LKLTSFRASKQQQKQQREGGKRRKKGRREKRRRRRWEQETGTVEMGEKGVYLRYEHFPDTLDEKASEDGCMAPTEL
jgi:hypothetical protein